MSKIVCVASGKGGVGKTTSVVNLGSALNKFGYETVIVDGNITTPNLGLHLGMPVGGTTLFDVLHNNKSIYESVYIHPNGTKIVPAGINMWELTNLPKTRINEIKKLKNFSDVVLIDCSPGINDEVETCFKLSDEVLVITNPDIPSVTDALKTISLARKLKKPVAGVIINKKSGKNFEMSIKNVEEFLGVPVISIVPDDENVKNSLSMRKAVVDAYPFTKASFGFKKAAAVLVGQDYNAINNHGFINKIKNVFGFH